MIRTQVPAYTCPSDSNSQAMSLYNGTAFFNYVGNYGNTTMDRFSPYGTDTAGKPNLWGRVRWADGPRQAR